MEEIIGNVAGVIDAAPLSACGASDLCVAFTVLFYGDDSRLVSKSRLALGGQFVLFITIGFKCTVRGLRRLEYVFGARSTLLFGRLVGIVVAPSPDHVVDDVALALDRGLVARTRTRA